MAQLSGGGTSVRLARGICAACPAWEEGHQSSKGICSIAGYPSWCNGDCRCFICSSKRLPLRRRLLSDAGPCSPYQIVLL